ncbi:glutathione-regulated potassium-efflux system protein KefC [Psychromonas sp. CNPT3]|uniref:cation:proton antiporter family protein n=1 Tax=Psychromonas sp. CNPT3 TaxID=314282 RepID=UPI0002C07E3F|nr:cation:proton antiporter family protein [Psychromonas sp. CNPT3]AGH80599.1 glutathione-regulated potassium-efflux system protein KefC [Psychromonas sp. CNPT3]
MDHTLLLFIGTAFSFGMLINMTGLPPMVGFLIAGFALNYLGFEESQTLSTLAHLGVTLLLFSIGLKLNIRTLLKREVWGGASIQMFCSVLFYSLLLLIFKQLGLSFFNHLDTPGLILVAFLLSFSSTVFAVKILEAKSETNSLYGRIAIGMLIMQDIFAVLFLTISVGELPSIWAFGLFALPLLRPILFKLLDRAGHGELLVLYGVFLALGMGAGLFEYLGLEADLGALVAGMLLASHRTAKDMANALFNMKEIFLICFFLSIGLKGLPNIDHFMIAILLSCLLLGKTALYFFTLTKFNLRSRTSLFAAFSLANYSEFGLIVASLAYAKGWLSSDWLTITAIAVSLSFIISALLNKYSDPIYSHFTHSLKRFQSKRLHKDDRPVRVGDAQILVMGMGRIGVGAYDALKIHYGKKVMGVDYDHQTTIKHRKLGRRVITGDALDSDFWTKLQLTDNIKLILLAMPDHNGNRYAAEQLNKIDHYNFKVAALAHYKDDEKELHKLGVAPVFNMYEEAGSGFAHHVWAELADTLSEENALKETKNPNVNFEE